MKRVHLRKQENPKTFLYIVVGMFLAMVWLMPTESLALDHFTCSCAAAGPGIERDPKSIKKYCSYDCKCIGIYPDGKTKMNIPVQVSNVITSAYSLEEWDAYSQICHGQYAWRPSLDSPAWKIKVKFAPFIITWKGLLIFPDSVEIAQGINQQEKPFNTSATEVLEELTKVLQSHN